MRDKESRIWYFEPLEVLERDFLVVRRGGVKFIFQSRLKIIISIPFDTFDEVGSEVNSGARF